MPIQPPNLDDRRMADLVAEARTRIPRYLPEWTDFNESDPGITLLELFAWMTDIMLYRLNQVPERNYLKFLQLLGIELAPAEPARADLTFTLTTETGGTGGAGRAASVQDAVIIPKGTQVAASGESGSVLFETETDLIALSAALQAVQSFDGSNYIAHTRKNILVGQDFYPFGPVPREGNALLLGFDATNPFTEQQINLMIAISPTNASLEGVQCSSDEAPQPLPATIFWEYWSGQQWLPLTLARDETQALTQNGHIYLQGVGNLCQSRRIGPVSSELYWIRARLATTSYQLPPRLKMIATNTVSALQAVTVRGESLGASNGLPSQRFQLVQTPIIAGSLRLHVDEGDGPQTWQEVSDFYASKPDDRHYTLNRTTGEITFGNGLNGRIPQTGPVSNTIVASAYRYGGGKQGNVGANTITTLQDIVKGVQNVTNLEAAFGGTDEETVEQAKQRAPQELKSKGRAVTTEDFEHIAVATPSTMIRRAKALPLTHPRFPDQRIPGAVTVIVVPERDPNSSQPPMPTPATLARVSAHLNHHRLLTTEVYVVPPTYLAVQIKTTLVVNASANLSIVRQAVIDKLHAYFDPLSGGDDSQGWPFGGGIYFSKIYRISMGVEGVDYIQNNQLAVFVDGQRFISDIPLPPNSLPYLALTESDILFIHP